MFKNKYFLLFFLSLLNYFIDLFINLYFDNIFCVYFSDISENFGVILSTGKGNNNITWM